MIFFSNSYVMPSYMNYGIHQVRYYIVRLKLHFYFKICEQLLYSHLKGTGPG